MVILEHPQMTTVFPGSYQESAALWNAMVMRLLGTGLRDPDAACSIS